MPIINNQRNNQQINRFIKTVVRYSPACNSCWNSLFLLMLNNFFLLLILFICIFKMQILTQFLPLCFCFSLNFSQCLSFRWRMCVMPNKRTNLSESDFMSRALMWWLEILLTKFWNSFLNIYCDCTFNYTNIRDMSNCRAAVPGHLSQTGSYGRADDLL